MYMRTVIGIPIYGCEYRFTLYMIHGIRNRKNPWAGNILCKCDAKLHFKGTESDTWLRVRKRESYSALLGETMLIEDPSFFPLSLSLSEMKGFSISKLSTLLISFVSTFSSLSLLIEFLYWWTQKLWKFRRWNVKELSLLQFVFLIFTLCRSLNWGYYIFRAIMQIKLVFDTSCVVTKNPNKEQ